MQLIANESNLINHITSWLGDSRTKKRQVCVRIEESIVAGMEQVREKTGVPVSKQIELRLKGFAITSFPERGNPDEIWRLFSNLEKDEELANNIDEKEM